MNQLAGRLGAARDELEAVRGEARASRGAPESIAESALASAEGKGAVAGAEHEDAQAPLPPQQEERQRHGLRTSLHREPRRKHVADG